ncbi:hypothetical protein [Persicobacter psychrovividus]|uniref:DUF4148 domain-containing protein n=1 Tax=Persicobacter psychrovividus TaxID=387638 RepID=A0ABM7VDP9_9BACT|nr:hypothetical protein PEPS_10620 [Persicobacter psychrovividus]
MKKLAVLAVALGLGFGAQAQEVKSNKNAVAKARIEKMNKSEVAEFTANSKSDKVGRAQAQNQMMIKQHDQENETVTVKKVKSDKTTRKLVK